jgi:hypothetical protein
MASSQFLYKSLLPFKKQRRDLSKITGNPILSGKNENGKKSKSLTTIIDDTDPFLHQPDRLRA